MELEIEVTARDGRIYGTVAYTATTDQVANPLRRFAVGHGNSFWYAVADAILDAHTTLHGRLDLAA